MSSRPLVHFAHATGFPGACYQQFFKALGDDIDIIMIPLIGHDARYPIAGNWHHLADEIAESVRRQSDGRPVIGLGHSLGGMTSFMAAHRYPDLFRGLIMLDPAFIPPAGALVMGWYKLMGRIDDITPAGRSLGRREVWPSRDEARSTLRHKSLFRNFEDACFEDYLRYGLTDCEAGVRLTYEAAREVEIFRHTPSDTWRYRRPLDIPRAVVTGETSEFKKRGAMRKLAIAQGVPLLETPGAHMFPFEQSAATATLVREHILRMHAGS